MKTVDRVAFGILGAVNVPLQIITLPLFAPYMPLTAVIVAIGYYNKRTSVGDITPVEEVDAEHFPVQS